jgi:hypothetical protein
MQGGDEDGEGGGSDIGALLGNLGPLIGGLSGVSNIFKYVYIKVLNSYSVFFNAMNSVHFCSISAFGWI